MSKKLIAEIEVGKETAEPIDTSNWTEEDWYKNNVKAGMAETDARFAAAAAVGKIDLNDEEIDY
jgi:hypothetical protein